MPRIQQLHRELDRRHLAFRPHFWLSDEWYTPDGVPGVAIPFYLGHPRLAELERNQMREVEGGTPEWCMRILRHETGHAIENAYRLRRRRRRQQLFGKTSQPYPQHYAPKPYSKRYVLHLEQWYAQSHPDEDFAGSRCGWRRTPLARAVLRWPVLRKLEYVDVTMREIANWRPTVVSRARVDPCPGSGRPCFSTTRRSAGTTGLDSTSPTTGISAGCSRRRRVRGGRPRPASSAGSGGGAAAWPRAPASTSTRSTRCSGT
jgi:hypothetical protein